MKSLVVPVLALALITTAAVRLQSPKDDRPNPKRTRISAAAAMVPPLPPRVISTNVGVGLAWDHSQTNILKYRVYYGARSRDYTGYQDVFTNYVWLTNAMRFYTNYFAVTAISVLESDYSEELAWKWSPRTNSAVWVEVFRSGALFTNLPPMTNRPGMGFWRLQIAPGQAGIQGGPSIRGPWTNALQWPASNANWAIGIRRTNW